ncbi:hypothetical protein QTP88_018845 [Uroleucon formosanum]
MTNMKNILNKVPENIHSFEVSEEWNNNPNIQFTDLHGVSKSLDEKPMLICLVKLTKEIVSFHIFELSNLFYISVKLESFKKTGPAKFFACQSFGHGTQRCGYPPHTALNAPETMVSKILKNLRTRTSVKQLNLLTRPLALKEQHSGDVNDLSSCNNNNEIQQPNDCESSDLNLFTRASTANFAKYWLFHPNQPKISVPFAYKKTYFRIDGGNCKWVSLRSIDKSLFCCICLCYGDGSGLFSKGIIDWKHAYTRINEHENSRTHRFNVDAHVMKKQFSSIDSLLTYGHSSIRKKVIENRRQVLFRTINIIKLIDHGNFLEMILLVGKYDPVLKAHLDKAIKNSTKSHDSGSKQGGGHISFLSKTTVNYIIEIISEIKKSSISEEIIKAGIYSVQLDTIQDVSVIDQCSVIIRYVNGTSVKERLVGMIKCKSSKGIAFVDLVLQVFHNLNIKANNCVGNATDRAANMQGQYTYNGFSAKLSDITLKVLQSITLFGILNGCAVFIRESHIRMDVWTTMNSRKRVCTIGETRWLSKDASLTKIFGKEINIMTVYQMVTQTLQDLRKCTREFSRTKDAADKFVQHTNKMFQKMKNNVIEIANSLPQSRKKKKTKQFHDYEADDDPITDPLHSYEVNVYNQVLDTVIESISSRFEKHGQLCADFACLDPNNFKPDVTFPKNALIECSNDVELLVSCSHNPNTNAKYCVVSCFDMLVNLFVAYKLMLTLSVTQVGCERSFSKLKYIKNYLRNTLGQGILEIFMLMNVEKDLLSTIDSNDVINKLAARNSTFKNLLSF